MNILDRIAGVRDDSSPTEAVKDERRHTLAYAREAHRRGLQGVRVFSTGQQRRAEGRFVAGQQRKNRRKYRKNWYQNRDARAVLRGQLWVVDHPHDVSLGLLENTLKRLTEAYGDIDGARKYAGEINLTVAS